MSADTDARLSSQEAAPLLHAVAASVATTNAVRALAIKGPALTVQGIREARVHADIDVLVHPDELELFLSSMCAVGWRRGLESTAPTIMPVHSVSLLSDFWPVTIDVHHYFPGFLAPPGEVFETFWERRVDVELAGVQVPTLDPVAHAALAALHLLRDQRSAVNHDALESLARMVRLNLAADAPDDLEILANDTGARATLRPFLALLGRCGGADHVDAPAELALWRREVTSPASSPWVLRLLETPPRRWVGTMWNALMLTDEEIVVFHGGGGGSLLRLRSRRLRRGLRTVPRAALRLWRDSRRP